jgi:hypothetical protein
VLLALGAMGFPAKEELSVEPPLQEQVVENRTTVEQPYNGRWRVSHNGAAIGAVNGDFVIGFTARDQHGSVLGTFSTSEGALDAVLDN